ncbi:winged helix-turn-helix transcriptional regulator [Sulfitobacter geojensis]|jgi:DNA-binding HxlR family transcriptional regulator|uniref:Helix-turn-helix transcriptional regulator n=1 Tax=Sulfitobacter geojensis TaxID=1342299 RepID=A0AAE2W182_9RHOB|nr:winged helix-turn-helix transcriptional regulator [Sulfitobacter geojensis]MBM1691064.1 helix-turn-helix transcriptional regulator [Sulfitobacter geojensis]MBM1695130.1 helix-turn-helix transcriptional regulator [Sulfitobacter geojensis]MBM1707203.1 helix-turn-helix transcriptional regulator [Sulfitobacter geojensis]MBM1711353.1 helix-turn-helix transcriptional regulator [Sulfitobacter geojensis]MBM1715328.1 helix-turn-helix transcriptional regulator [Sulfitobacter geojensis]
MDINLVVKITARAWSLRILALLHEGVAGRQAALLKATQAGRTAFAQSLHHLIDLNLLERNPGHGHPLRPEYRLTPTGIDAAAMASRITRVAPDETDAVLLRRAWTLPVLSVSPAPSSFTEIKTSLPPITDRALSQTLKQLQGHNWLMRQVDTNAHPPRAKYHAVNAGLQINKAVSLFSPAGRLL